MTTLKATFSGLCRVWAGIFLTLLSCGGASNDSSSTQSEVAQLGAGVSALFGGFGSDSSLSELTRGLSLDAAQEICNGLYAGPDKVFMMGRGYPGTYGSATDSITVVETDFCEDSNGDDVTGAASDGGELFAMFSLLDEVSGTCTEDGVVSTMAMVQGSGIARNTDEHTEIFGRFEINDEFVDCTLRLASDGSIDADDSSCTDAASAAVDIATDATCTLNGDVARLALPETIEGQFAVSNDEGYSVSYECWFPYPPLVDTDGFLDLGLDCTTFDSYGFNLVGVSFGVTVGGDETNWEVYTTFDEGEMANRIKILHLAGYPVFAEIDILYTAAYNGTNPGVIDDSSEFPQALIDNTDLRANLAERIFELADLAEGLNVELLAPMAESDRVFANSTATNPNSTFVQSFLSELADHYSGSLMWIAASYDNTDAAEYNLTGFDYAGANISPAPNHNTRADFVTHVDTQLSNMKTLANAVGIPYLISNAGIWGEALTNDYDWNLDADRVLDAFQIMTQESTSYGTTGIMYWEGGANEVVIGDYPALGVYISDQFGGTR